MNNNIIWILFLTIYIGVGCNEKMVVIPEFVPPTTDRVVLIEELTGASCPNCPAGTAAVEQILENFPDNVVAVAVHGDFLAKPVTGESQYDFRSEEGKNLEDYLRPWLGKPAAAINRVQFDDHPSELSVSISGLWQSLVQDELDKAHVMSIFVGSDYNPVSREVDVTVSINPLVDLTGDFRLSVMLTQSHIIDAQLNSAEVIPDFEHNHVLRKILTAFNGNPLPSTLAKDDIIARSFTYVLPEEDLGGPYIPENMHVVASVANVAGDSKEVYQAAEEDLF